jgi:type IV secretory pathway component VirB8
MAVVFAESQQSLGKVEAIDEHRRYRRRKQKRDWFGAHHIFDRTTINSGTSAVSIIAMQPVCTTATFLLAFDSMDKEARMSSHAHSSLWL